MRFPNDIKPESFGSFLKCKAFGMLAQFAGQLSAEMCQTKWSWDRSTIFSLLSGLRWTHLADVEHRSEFGVQDQIQASVYFQKDRCLFVEVVLDWFDDSDQLDDEEYENSVDEYFDKFEQTVQAVSKVLGEPLFSDGAAAKGFPKDQDAVWLALWKCPSCRFMVQQKHEERELPFRICLVVAPPD